MGWPLPGIGACTGKRDSERQKPSQRKFGHVLTMQSVRSSSSILGSGHLRLGTASHGCIRLWLPCTHAQLVQADGMANTKVLIKGPDPAGFPRTPVLGTLMSAIRT
jgi:hypothetical protein